MDNSRTRKLVHFSELEDSGNLPPINAIDWNLTDEKDHPNYLTIPSETILRYLENKFKTMQELLNHLRTPSYRTNGVLHAVAVLKTLGFDEDLKNDFYE